MRPMISDKLLRSSRVAGFTLVELIIVMVISGLISGAVVLLVRQPLQNYAEISDRTELTDIADNALRLLARELRAAVPNTVRISGDGRTLEFIPSLGGGRYFAPADVSSPLEVALNFSVLAATTFTAAFAQPPPPLPNALVPGNFIVIYNLGPGFSFSDAYQTGANNGNRAEIVNVAGNNIQIGDPQAAGAPTATNVFARSPVPNGSPTQRFHVAGRPVIYRCTPTGVGGNGELRRIAGLAFSPVQVVPIAPGAGDLVVDNVSSCLFRAVTSAHRIGALVTLDLTIQRNGPNQPVVTLSRQVQIDNTP